MRRWLLAAVCVTGLAPVALLAVRALGRAWVFPALLPGGGHDGIAALLGDPRIGAAFATSLTLAVATGVLATLIGGAAGRAFHRARGTARRMAGMAAFLPVIAPPMALGVGGQVLTLRLGIAGTWAGVLLGHLVPAAGYVTLYLVGVFGAWDLALEEAARTLGASRLQVLARVVWPALRTPLAQGVAIGALVSWGQLALTLVIGGGNVRTLPVELLGFVRAGDDRLAAVSALILTLPPVVGFALVRRGARVAGIAA